MLYCDAATFCRRRNDAGIMTDETGRRCITKEHRYYNNEKQILLSIHYQNNFDYLLTCSLFFFSGCKGKKIIGDTKKCIARI